MNARHFALFILIFLSMYANAQSIVVKDFHRLDRDLTANTEGTSRISKQDGTVAALIKVVTTEHGFNFDGGSYSLVGDPVYMPGEIWLYVPYRLQKITISHSRFGTLRDYFFPITLEAGRTYEMLLDPGVGRYVTIQTQVPRSEVYLDGDSIGVSPIYNHYILYGQHTLRADNDRMEGSLTIAIPKYGSNDLLNFTVPMVDQSEHFGTVVIETSRDAEILMNGQVKGVGRWSGSLREGNYVVETHKVNCDNAKTTFTVMPKQVTNVNALPPTPHKGYLQLFCRPNDLHISVNNASIPFTEHLDLPVGIQTVTYNHKGYHSLQRDYYVRHNVTIADTIELSRIQYLKSNGFYFGGAYSIGQFSGVTGCFGFLYSNFDLQLSYTFGLDKTKPVNHYDPEDNAFRSKSEYAVNAFSIKLGYQYRLATKFGIVPQLGIATKMLRCTLLEGSEPFGESTSRSDLTLGCKFIFTPVQHFCIFAAPEYDVAVSKDIVYDAITKAAAFSTDGFFCNLGILINF